MEFCWKRYTLMGVLMVCLAFALGGCGGGGGGGGGDGTTGFTVTGSINFASGAPINSTTVKLYKTSYTIYSTATVAGKLYGTRNAAGEESVALGPLTQETTVATSGINRNYTFTGVPSGNYTIVPSQQGYLFKSVLIPTLDRIGVLTITENGTVYLYNPEGTGNQLTSDGKIIYNSTLPGLSNQDFEASLPGGT